MNLLVTGAWPDGKAKLNELEKLGHTVSFMQYEKDPLPISYESVEGVICNGLFLHHPIEKFVNLRYIQLTSAGFDRVPMEYIREHGMEIHNARGVYSVPMAEFAISGVLQLYKKSNFFALNQKRHQWEKHRGLLELYGKTVGIVGCGSVGTECAKRFTAFDCHVIGLDLVPREDSAYCQMLSISALDEILPDLDVIVLTLPLTEESHYLINKERFRKMKQGATLVNIARGAIVETAAMIKWLRAGNGAAVMDVFEEEPVPADSPLWDLENVILTPHNSFVGEGSPDRLKKLICENVRLCNEA